MPLPSPTANILEPVALERRSDPDVRKRMSGPAMRSFLQLADRWALSVEERRALLGWPSESTYHNYRNGNVGTLSYDVLTRISLLIGMFKALHMLYPDFADRWMKLPNSNPIFGGHPPIALMSADGGIDSLYRVRRLLDARRGGWN
jgi:antitoxin Xre/MbcA/ParS-like protein